MVKGSNKGFSLVELMVVVSIIGILAAIAIPSVTKYMAKARQSEAKSNLSSLYTAEKAFFAEYNTFDSRFAAIGFTPEGQLRYAVGFTAAGAQAGAGNGYTTAPGDLSISSTAYCGVAGVMNANGCTTLNDANGAQPALDDIACPAGGGSVAAAGCTTAQPTFRVGARAQIVSGGVAPIDAWTIDDVKVLRNTVNGIQ